MIEVCCCTLCHREYPAEDLIRFDGKKSLPWLYGVAHQNL